MTKEKEVAEEEQPIYAVEEDWPMGAPPGTTLIPRAEFIKRLRQKAPEKEDK